MKRAPFVLAVLLLGTGCNLKETMLNLNHLTGANIAVQGRRQFMQRASLQSLDENTIERSVIIERPVESVYDFYDDFKNLPTFLGDVMNIEQAGPATTRWTIQGPFRIQAHWTIKVTEERRNELIRYETISSPGLRTFWEIYFSPGPKPGQTELREIMRAPLGRLGRIALALIGKYPAEEVSANLHRLKQVMETGKVTDTSYSVPGKFSEHP